MCKEYFSFVKQFNILFWDVSTGANRFTLGFQIVIFLLTISLLQLNKYSVGILLPLRYTILVFILVTLKKLRTFQNYFKLARSL